MKDVTKLTRALEAQLQEELSSQGRLLVHVAAQEAAIQANDSVALASVTREVERELAGNKLRHMRRTALLGAFAGVFGVDPDLVTLGSLVERLGDQAGGLREQRAELRKRAARIQRATRRLRKLVATHQRLVRDVLHVVLDDDVAGSPLDGAGSLVNAEA